MKVLIIGATGPTGQQIVQQALAQGHEVTALVRNPDQFEMQHDLRREYALEPKTGLRKATSKNSLHTLSQQDCSRCRLD